MADYWFKVLFPHFRSDPDDDNYHQSNQEKSPPHTGFKNGFYRPAAT